MFQRPSRSLGDPLYIPLLRSRLVVLGIAHGSQQGALFTLSQLLIMPLYMDDTSALDILEGFSNALARCSEHPVGSWAML